MSDHEDHELIMNDLKLKYKPLVGVEFEGTYQGEREMPQTENPRDVLSIEEEAPFAEVLQEISQAVKQAYGKQIWKGITGPEDSDSFTDYWLWVESCFSGVLEKESTHNFRVQKCTPFKGNGVQFSYGVSIRVSVIPPALSSSEED